MRDDNTPRTPPDVSTTAHFLLLHPFFQFYPRHQPTPAQNYAFFPSWPFSAPHHAAPGTPSPPCRYIFLLQALGEERSGAGPCCGHSASRSAPERRPLPPVPLTQTKPRGAGARPPPHAPAGPGRGRHLLPAVTGGGPARPPATGRVSLCRRRRHLPAAAALPPAVRFLHSPGPPRGRLPLPAPPPFLTPPALRKRSTSPGPPAHTNGGRPTPATQARSENSALRSSHAPHRRAVKGAARLAAGGG